ncbi:MULTISPECIES: phosphotransferase enzyme family protein [Streptomyces]|uniref:phosphotransferase enzyme family protein n=1 Tax=Streptomyces TaxID=1883 RepID=UPI0036C45E84
MIGDGFPRGIGLDEWLTERLLADGVWLVRHPTDPDRPRLVVKRKHGYLSESEFSAQGTVHRRAHAAGAPVPAIPPFLAPSPVRGTDGVLYQVCCWVDGVPVERGDRSGLSALGAAMAQFHRSCENALDDVVYEAQEPHDRFEKARFHFPLLAEGLGADGSIRLRLLEAALVTAEADLASRPPIPHVVVHGDPCPENGVLGPDGTVSLIDLDDVHMGPAVADVAYLLISVGAVMFGGDRFLPAWDEPSVAAVLNGYLARRPLSDLEWDGLAPWLTAGLCCAVTDQLYHNGWKIPTTELSAECSKVLALVDPAALADVVKTARSRS